MSDTTPAPADFDDPLDLVDRTDLSYKTRLDILQRWKADSPPGEADRIQAAIDALETGAAVQADGPDVEVRHGYGIQKKGGSES